MRRVAIGFLAAVIALMVSSVAFAADWKVGDKCEVEWKGSWYTSTILEIKDGKYKIHYDGWGPEWDEYVGPERMRKKP